MLSIAAFVCIAGVVKALQLPSQALHRIPEHSSLESFASALSQGSAAGVVSAVLGIVAEHQGVHLAPLSMLASHCKVGSCKHYTPHTALPLNAPYKCFLSACTQHLHHHAKPYCY